MSPSGHLNEAIWQFRIFERASLDYLGPALAGEASDAPVGLWDTTTTRSVLEAEDSTDRQRPAQIAASGLLKVGDILRSSGASTQTTAVVTADYGLEVDGTYCRTPDEAAAHATDGKVDVRWDFWTLDGYGTLEEMADLAESGA